jgi:glucose/arabinose dehydrogenase
MRLSRFLPFLLVFALLAPLFAVDTRSTAPTAPTEKPFGIDKRIPWTTSHVLGSPDPPLPYRIKQTFTKLKLPCPIAIAHEPGTRNLIVVYQLRAWTGAGRIVRVADEPGVDHAEELLALDGIAYGVAFHPDFAHNGYMYVGDNGPLSAGPKKTRVTRYTINRQPPHALDPKSAKVVIEWESDGHNGGDVAFGNDGMLYITSGDGTSDSDTNRTGQDVTKLLAKVLRIDVDHPEPGREYSVPRDNPFLDVKDVRPETWAYGFRNPWRIHIDRPTGDIFVGQNGQDLWEQVYLVEKGANYGWSVMEGGHPFYLDRKRGPTPISKPLIDHPHSEMRSLTGGVVYRGKQLPELQGAYIYGDWSTGRIWGVKHLKGKITWHQELANTTMQITGFGLDADGELLIADHGGNAFYRLEANPREDKPARFPTRLSTTGLFASVKAHVPEAGLIPYSVNSPLWSDGAQKERFLALPGTAQIEFTTSRGWNLPEGAVLVKTFSLTMPDRTQRRIETRLLTRQVGKWVGYTYLWNDEQSEAELVDSAGIDRTFEVFDSAAPDGKRKQTWHYPSRAECMVCHSRAANFVLGLSTLQMNRVHDYGKVQDNQLRTLEHIGIFRIGTQDHLQGIEQRLARGKANTETGLAMAPRGLLNLLPAVPPTIAETGIAAQRVLAKPVADARRQAARPIDMLEELARNEAPYTTVLPKSPAEYDRLVDPYDASESLDRRARSYLHANCAQCHVEAGGGNAMMELEFTTPVAKSRTVAVKPLHHTFEVTGALLIAPGDPEKSILLQRILRRGEGQMPPLATSVVDERAAVLLRQWIKQMK